MTNCMSCPAAGKVGEAEMCGDCVSKQIKRGIEQQKYQILQMVENLSLHANNGGILMPDIKDMKDQESFIAGWTRALKSAQQVLKSRIEASSF